MEDSQLFEGSSWSLKVSIQSSILLFGVTKLEGHALFFTVSFVLEMIFIVIDVKCLHLTF